MSGIVGIFARRGASADHSLLEGLTDLLAFRGPDAQRVWSEGAIGFGHTLLSTAPEAAQERQPASLDNRWFITADARLDRRSELIAEIENENSPVSPSASDAELILRAYAAWGADCVHHLRGDFAFAIWDSLRRILFCARDHLGVKPFYYADFGEAFLFSNTLDCVRAHPGVSDELNDQAIADFLLWGFNPNLETTSFRDLRRLPPAHFLVVSADEIRAERYWSPPVDGRIRYRRDAEYVEHFQSLFRDAVADRLRGARVGVWMSGGMDSPAVAATARSLSAAPGDICAYTRVYESLIPDGERDPAQQVADFLDIPIHYLKMDGVPLFGGPDDPALDSPEPIEDPFFGGIREQYRQIANDRRVMFSGDGADALMHFQMWPYVRDLYRRREWTRLASEVPAFLWARPFPWKGLRERARRVFGHHDSDIPDWMSAELQARLNRESAAREPKVSAFHPFAPMAYAFLSAPQWSTIFELASPGATGAPLETRYPFLDLRIVEYLLAIPPYPWAYGKRILRQAMAGQLPDATLRRRKAPLAGDPIRATIGRLGTSEFEGLPWDPESDRFLDRSALRRRLKTGQLDGGELLVRPLCLNFWLRSRRRIGYKLPAEVRNG